MNTERVLKVGPKGGHYWEDENGKKHYVKSKKSKVVKEPLKMKRYTINICVRKDGCYYDDFNEWRDAYCREGALQKVREDYPNEKKYELTITDVREL